MKAWKPIVLTALLFTLGACASIQDRIGPYAKRTADIYCTATPLTRTALRTEVTTAIAPHKLTMECATVPK